ncbi:MAG: LegC family aminotransferase [Clostridiaceae bacterium]
MSKFIPLSIPNLCGNELKYVSNALKTQWVSTGGEYINQFENNISKYLNVDIAAACQSGTSGLHLALILCGIERGEEVLVPALTFIAAVNPVRYLGSEPIFIDCDDSLTIDPIKLEEFCNNQCYFKDGNLVNKSTGRKIRAIIVVHVFGNIADMEKIIGIAENFNLKVIEDATEALGTYYISGRYKGKHAGTIGDFGVYSFNGNKIITTGGGGMLVGSDVELVKKAKYLSTQAKDDEIYYIHNEIGYNYRMTNLQAALGVAQLENLEKFIIIKMRNYLTYKNELDKIECFKLLEFNKKTRSNYWFYSLLLIEEKFNRSRDQLISYLSKNNIQTRPIWGLICDQKPYRSNQRYKLEKCRFYIDHIINIPCSTNLKEEDVNYIVNTIKNYGK